MPTAITSSAYSIELRDKDGNLKTYLTPHVSDVSWEWNRLGGCGRCSITIKKPYRDIEFDGRDDIQIRVKSGSTSKLVYRGFIANITPTLKVNQEIKLDVRGYFDLLDKIIVQTTGDVRTYTTDEVSVIATDIVDTFITPNTSITKGTINAGSFECDSIQFLCTVKEALKTLSDLTGDIEYGVDEDLVFFWRTESTTINNKFFAGNNIVSLERRVNWDELTNRIYLVGGDPGDGSKYKRTAEATDSQALYFLSETIINNSAITTQTVADQYLGAILAEKATPQYNIRAKIVNTDIRIEDTIPLGLVTFYDATYDRNSVDDAIGDIIGLTADGGSDITIGLAADGGDDATIGGLYSAQVDRISYKLSDTPGRFDIEIQLGDTVLDTSAKIKRLELALSNLNQY